MYFLIRKGIPAIFIIAVVALLYGLCTMESPKEAIQEEVIKAKVATDAAVSDDKTEEEVDDTPPGKTIWKDNGLVETKRVEGKIKKKNGELFFKNKDGVIVKEKFFTYKKNVYRAEKSGVLSRGWRTVLGHYYFFDRKTGKMLFNKKSDGIKIKKNGIAKETDYSVSKIKTLITARKIMNSVSKPTESREDRLYKCFKWVEALGYNRYRTYEEAKVSNPEDWEIVFANDCFENHMGCCVSFSAALAFFAKECGYDPVKVCCDTAHAWTDIEGRLYDPLFAESRDFNANYNAAYTDFRANPPVSKEI